MTRDELGGRMSSREFAGWLAYESLYGLPDNVSLAAQVFMTVAAAAASKPLKLADVVPYYRPQVKARQAADDMLAAMDRFAARHNAREDRRGQG